MKHAILLVMMALASVAAADPLPELFDAAEPVNHSYRTMAIDWELAQRRYERSLIGAQDNQAELEAEIALVQSQIARRSSLRAFQTEVLAAVIEAATSERSVRSAELSHAIAENALVLARTRFNGGLISDETLRQTQLALYREEEALRAAQFGADQAAANLQRVTGLSFSESLVPPEPGVVIAADEQQFMEANLTLRLARLSLESARLDQESLASNAAQYDLLVVQRTVEKRELALADAAADQQAAFASLERSLQGQEVALRVAGEELEIEQSLLMDAEARFERGLITRDSRDQQQISVINAEIARLRALQSYLATILEYSVAVDIDVVGVL